MSKPFGTKTEPGMILDCTLRDGGYVNNWGFDFDTARKIMDGLYDAGVRYIELGIMGNGGNVDIKAGNVCAYAEANVTKMGVLNVYSVMNLKTGNVNVKGGNIIAEIVSSITNSSAEIQNFVAGIYHNSTGSLNLSGGNVTANIDNSSTYSKVKTFCSSVWNNSSGNMTVDGSTLYANNKGSRSTGDGFIAGIVGQGLGKLYFLSGKINVEGKGYGAFGINNVNGIIKDVDE